MIYGLIYGVIVNFLMQYGVIPLSSIGGPGPFKLDLPLVNRIVGHALLVGLPVALIASWSAKVKRTQDFSAVI